MRPLGVSFHNLSAHAARSQVLDLDADPLLLVPPLVVLEPPWARTPVRPPRCRCDARC